MSVAPRDEPAPEGDAHPDPFRTRGRRFVTECDGARVVSTQPPSPRVLAKIARLVRGAREKPNTIP
jgi:hypothetical protein